MKKKISSSFAFFALMILSSLGFAQKNLTLILKGNVNESYFNNKEFAYNLSAANQQAVVTFIEKAKVNVDIASIKTTGKDAVGNYQVIMLMKQTHDKNYYLKLVMNLGVDYILANDSGEKKTPQELLNEKPHSHDEHSTKAE